MTLCRKQVFFPPLQHKARNPGKREATVSSSEGSRPGVERPTELCVFHQERRVGIEPPVALQTVGNRALQASRCRATMNRRSLHYLHGGRLHSQIE